MANGFGFGAVCDGLGHPTANTYTCGQPNVFQGRYVANAPNVLSFTVPFNPPGITDEGEALHRIFRLTNVRVAPLI